MQNDQLSSNKDLQEATRNQQFPMFGYQVVSSETAGIGDIYDTAGANASGHVTNGGNGGGGGDNSAGGRNRIVSGSHNMSSASSTQKGKYNHADAESNEQSLQSKKNLYNYENSIQMWGGPKK